MVTTTEYGTWVNHNNATTVEDTVSAYLGDFAQDYDFDGLVHAYRDAINNALAGGVSLNGNQFYGPYPMPANAVDAIADAISSIDLGELAAEYDRS
jgi:hypothetical protein